MSELTEAVVQWSETGHAGPGWYVWSIEYPEEGSLAFDVRPSAPLLAQYGYTESDPG